MQTQLGPSLSFQHFNSSMTAVVTLFHTSLPPPTHTPAHVYTNYTDPAWSSSHAHTCVHTPAHVYSNYKDPAWSSTRIQRSAVQRPNLVQYKYPAWCSTKIQPGAVQRDKLVQYKDPAWCSTKIQPGEVRRSSLAPLALPTLHPAVHAPPWYIC